MIIYIYNFNCVAMLEEVGRQIFGLARSSSLNEVIIDLFLKHDCFMSLM